MAEVRVGVVFRTQSSPEELRETVAAADEAGIDELWLGFPEHGLGAAAAALAWSERLTVGIGLLPPRDPAVAATEIAMVARLFPGRFVPAVGTAHAVALLREHADAVRRLLHGETVEVAGRSE
jgi:alkanesulfonate monooxygenase SsuD/methylene tetrahydromethanopterin reductase-like flavin-dependent oxidoreductase (luciferase family)